MDRTNFDQLMEEVELRKAVQESLWKSAMAEVHTRVNTSRAKRLSLIAHHETSSHPLWLTVSHRSAQLACQAVQQLRDEVLQLLEGEPVDG
jgi:hypothetical protein